MKRSTESLPGLWRALNLVQDYVSSGFSRRRPELIVAGPARAEEKTQSRQEEQRASPADDPAVIASEIASCVMCGLCTGRKTTVPGEGSLEPPVMFVGEGPGEEEDRTGRPFVGAAGRYLDKWIPAIGLRREECFIANVVKCRPPRNREPHPEEIAACLPYLQRQIRAVKPRAICCLGRIAAHTLLQTTASLGALRGKAHTWQGIPLVVTYHPSAVLRDTSLRKPVWDDLKLLKTLL
jgi:DNA polymerase